MHQKYYIYFNVDLFSTTFFWKVLGIFFHDELYFLSHLAIKYLLYFPEKKLGNPDGRLCSICV